LESLDQNTYDIAVRLGIRCLLHRVLVRNKDPSNVLQNVLSFRDEDTLLADGEFCEYAKIVCYTSPNESGTLPLYKVRMIDRLAEIYFHYIQIQVEHKVVAEASTLIEALYQWVNVLSVFWLDVHTGLFSVRCSRWVRMLRI